MLGLDEDMVISLEIPPNDRIESTGKDVSITSLQYTNVLGHVDHKLFWVVSRPGPQISTNFEVGKAVFSIKGRVTLFRLDVHLGPSVTLVKE